MKKLPLNPSIITSKYGNRQPFYANGILTPSFHGGVDMKACHHQEIYSVDDGSVVLATYHYSYGNYVIIKHEGYESLYAHLHKLNVKYGQKIKAGDIIGFAGTTGQSTGTHLHFELRENGKRFNPEPEIIKLNEILKYKNFALKVLSEKTCEILQNRNIYEWNPEILMKFGKLVEKLEKYETVKADDYL